MTIPFTYIVTHVSGLWYYGVRYAEGCDPSDLWNVYFTSSADVAELIYRDGAESFSCDIRKTFKSASAARRWESKVLRKILGWRGCLNKSAWPAVTEEARSKGNKTKAKIGEDGLTGYERATKKWMKKRHQINPKTGRTYEQDRLLKCTMTSSTPLGILRQRVKAEKTSLRMRENNPSKNPETRIKMTESLNKRISEGSFPTTKGRKFPQISEKLKGKQFTLGKKWYNDGCNNYRYSDGAIEIEKLIPGRLNRSGAIMKGFVHKTKICPHCKLEGGGGNMKTYHFDNCKMK